MINITLMIICQIKYKDIFKIKHNFLLKHNVTYNNFCKNSIKLIFLQIEEFYLYMDHRKSLQNTLRMILRIRFFKLESKFLVYHFDHISNWLVLVALNKPLSEVSLDGHVKLFLLVRSQPSVLNFLLNLGEALQSGLQYLLVVFWAKQ